MPSPDHDSDALDTKLRAAGERWRARQAFEQTIVPTELFKRTVAARSLAASMRGAFELAMVAAVALAVLVLGPLGPRLGLAGGDGSASTATALPPGDVTTAPQTSPAATIDSADTEAVRQAVIAAVTSDPTNFGGVYIERDGTLVIQYVGQTDARASVEAMLIPDIAVRWEAVNRSHSELLRIAVEIKDRNLPGVFAIAVDTIHNQVAVTVGSTGSLALVEAALSADYGSGVSVAFSSDVIVVLPGTARPSP